MGHLSYCKFCGNAAEYRCARCSEQICDAHDWRVEDIAQARDLARDFLPVDVSPEGGITASRGFVFRALHSELAPSIALVRFARTVMRPIDLSVEPHLIINEIGPVITWHKLFAYVNARGPRSWHDRGARVHVCLDCCEEHAAIIGDLLERGELCIEPTCMHPSVRTCICCGWHFCESHFGAGTNWQWLPSEVSPDRCPDCNAEALLIESERLRSTDAALAAEAGRRAFLRNERLESFGLPRSRPDECANRRWRLARISTGYGMAWRLSLDQNLRPETDGARASSAHGGP